MAKGYLIAQISITNPNAYALYAKAAGDLMKKYGGRSIVRPESAIILEGEGKQRNVIFEFPTFEKAKEFYQCAEYKAAKAMRQGAASADFIILDGID